MKIAVKFAPDAENLADGEELVLFRAQMLHDVFFHEAEPLPSLEDFLHKPMSRANDEKFWVYRQGTYIRSYIFTLGDLYVGRAKTVELDASRESIEGYHHVNTLDLNAGGKLGAIDSTTRFTALEQLQAFTDLHTDLRVALDSVAHR